MNYDKFQLALTDDTVKNSIIEAIGKLDEDDLELIDQSGCRVYVDSVTRKVVFSFGAADNDGWHRHVHHGAGPNEWFHYKWHASDLEPQEPDQLRSYLLSEVDMMVEGIENHLNDLLNVDSDESWEE